MDYYTTEYDNFKTRLLNTLAMELGTEITVNTRKVKGSGSTRLEACSISIPGKKVSPVFYPSYYFERYCNGTPFREIISCVEDSIRYTSDDIFDFEDVVDYREARGHIIPKLVNMKNNDELLEHVAHTTFLDLGVVFIYVIKVEGDEIISFTLTREQIAEWGQTVDAVFYDSIDNAKRLFPLSIESIEDVLGLNDDRLKSTFYVMSNTKRHYGAASMLYDHVLSDFAERIGESFSIIPSSVHEVLLVPDSLSIPADELRDMLLDVNSSIVKEEERLSDNVYHYSRDTGSLEIVGGDMRLTAAKE